MLVSNHRRHAHAQPRDHVGEPGGLSLVRDALQPRRVGRHGRPARGASVRRVGIGVLAVSLSTTLAAAPAAMAVSNSAATTAAQSVEDGWLAGPVTSPAAATWTLPDSDLPQVVMPVAPPPAPPTPASNPAPAAPTSPAAVKQYAASLVGAGQFGCLDKLWNRESGWNPAARNPSSGAFGIPQSLPGSKMASAGADWQSNPLTQVRWGVSYIKAAYGTPCGAWAHSQATGWY